MRLFHGAEHNMVDDFFLGLAATSFKELLHFQRRDSFSFQRQTVAQAQEEWSNGLHRVFIGSLVHPVEEREVLFL